MSLRPKEHALVRNHWQNKSWGPEERHGHFPVYFGQTFDILVLAEHHQYKIAVNGVHFCTFTHRIPLTRVRFVDVSGQGSIHYIGVEGDSGTVPNAPPMMPVIPGGPPPYTPMPPHGGIQVMPLPHPAFSQPGYPGPYPGAVGGGSKPPNTYKKATILKGLF